MILKTAADSSDIQLTTIIDTIQTTAVFGCMLSFEYRTCTYWKLHSKATEKVSESFQRPFRSEIV